MTTRRVLKFSTYVLLLVIGIALTGCGTYTSVRKHPDFADNSRIINTVAMLPPEVEYVHLVFDGDNERMTTKEASIAKTLQEAIPSNFKSYGYEISKTNLSEDIAKDTNLSYELEQLRKAYTTASSELYERAMVDEKESAGFKVAIGPIVNQFADLADADGLIMVRYFGFTKSDGLMTKEVVGNVLLAGLTGTYYQPARNGSAIEVALIDSNNGDVLWSNVKSVAFDGSYTIASSVLTQLPRNATNTAPSAEETQPVDTSGKIAATNLKDCEKALPENFNQTYFRVGKTLYDARAFTPAKLCFEKATTLDKDIAAQHDAYFHLGMMYELGQGIEADNETAKQLYAKAGLLEK
ncbi:SEL1-like repeat protein [Pseudomonadota bacterium]